MSDLELNIIVGVIVLIIGVVVNTVLNGYLKSGDKSDLQLQTLWDNYNEKKINIDKLEQLIETLNEFKLSNNNLKHNINNLTTSVNGFGARLSAIEEDVRDKLKIDHSLILRIEVLEKVILKKSTN